MEGGGGGVAAGAGAAGGTACGVGGIGAFVTTAAPHEKQNFDSSGNCMPQLEQYFIGVIWIFRKCSTYIYSLQIFFVFSIKKSRYALETYPLSLFCML